MKYLYLFLFVLISQIGYTQVVKTTYFTKNNIETKEIDQAHYFQEIAIDTTGENQFLKKEYYLPSKMVKLQGTVSIHNIHKYIGKKYELYENGHLASEENYSPDHQLIDTATYYYENGYIYLINNMPYTVDDKGNYKVTDTFILFHADSLGNVRLKNGNGYFESNTYFHPEEKGNYINYLKDGEWQGRFQKAYTFKEFYAQGILIKGVTTDSLGQKTSYNAATFTVDPEYPGGLEKLMSTVSKFYKYPPQALQAGVSGTIYIYFVVEKDGRLNQAKIHKDLGYGTGVEALKVLKKLDHWKPGLMRGIPVPVRYNLPIRLNSL